MENKTRGRGIYTHISPMICSCIMFTILVTSLCIFCLVFIFVDGNLKFGEKSPPSMEAVNHFVLKKKKKNEREKARYRGPRRNRWH